MAPRRLSDKMGEVLTTCQTLDGASLLLFFSFAYTHHFCFPALCLDWNPPRPTHLPPTQLLLLLLPCLEAKTSACFLPDKRDVQLSVHRAIIMEADVTNFSGLSVCIYVTHIGALWPDPLLGPWNVFGRKSHVGRARGENVFVPLDSSSSSSFHLPVSHEVEGVPGPPTYMYAFAPQKQTRLDWTFNRFLLFLVRETQKRARVNGISKKKKRKKEDLVVWWFTRLQTRRDLILL